MRIMEQYYNQQNIIDDLIREEKKISELYIKRIDKLCKELSLYMTEICKNKDQNEIKSEEFLKKENQCKEDIKEISVEFNSRYEFLKIRIEVECSKLDRLATLIELSKNFDRSYVKN